MFVVISFSILALLLTILESRGIIKGGMKLGFILVTVLAVIHYDYGSDYMSYLNRYKQITAVPFQFTSLLNGDYSDVGWTLLNYAFSHFGGFFMLVAVLSILQNVLVYKIIANNVSRKWWPLAVCIYLFSTSFYLLNFSMLRQGLVIIIFLSLWPMIRDRKWLFVLSVLYICSSIHSSALILLPFAFWGFLPTKNNKLMVLAYIFLYFSLWLGKDFMNNIFNSMLVIDEFDAYADTYDHETGDGVSFWGIGFIINLIPLIIALYYIYTNHVGNSDNIRVVALASIGFIIAPFVQIIPLITRLAMYFSVYSIVSLPLTYGSIKNNILRYAFVAIYLFMLFYDYWKFFNVGVFVKSYSEFHTIFSVILS